MHWKILRFLFFVILVFCFWYTVNIEKIQDVEKAAVFKNQIQPMTDFTVTTSTELPDREITLREAILISIEQAKEFGQNPELISIESKTDKKGTGKDGKKPNWNCIVSLPNEKYNMNIVIENGKLENYHFSDSSNDRPIKNFDISIDSDKFITIATQKYGLKPISIKKTSSEYFNFKIQRNDEQQAVFSIEGQGKSGKYMEIYFDPFDGNYLGRGIKETEDIE